ncbi:cytochrome P450 [Cyathus striatus]|nr:cytochrome P450 [Cyathus striatus]
MAWIYHFALSFAALCLLWSRRHRAKLLYPPGPPAEPIIGHLRIIPSTQQEVVFREWSKIYGDVMYLHIPGRSFLVLNSLKAATELLDKRSGIYSDRMRLILYELMGWFPTLTFLPYGKQFQKHRRLLQEYLNQKQCPSYQPLQTRQARRLLAHIADNPQNGTAGVMFAGGTETTYSALLFFLLAMVLFPECQKRAQAEIDEVIGKNRLPEFNDRGSLPYVEAVLQEVFRWNAVSPSDDVYNGMFVPKGTVVIPNAYAILRDKSVYTDPDSFDPNRYLPQPEGNAEPYPIGHFGFGRRICPGRYLASASLWIAISSMLATLDIERTIDEEGKEIVPEVDLATALTRTPFSHPKPFPCSIKPRDQTSESMIRQAQMWDYN